MPDESLTGLEIAIIGMTCRFPGANHIDEFWDNIKNGVEAISFFSDAELAEAGVGPGLFQDPGYIRAKGIIASEAVEAFDSGFFDYYPKEAAILNPQVRLLHECAWETLETAGYVPGSYDGLIGLYTGASNSTRWEMQSHFSETESDNPLDMFSIFTLADKDFLSTRLSYKLNLKGPSLNVQTACSTSLVAIHMASRALLTGECDMALAGGATVDMPQKAGYIYEQDLILSPDAHCRAFDARAKGTIDGNGIGIVLLKRLKNALADNDEIYAIIKGSAINNDGNRKVGYTAPSVEGQAEVIKSAQQMAEVEFESITYVETHGTATPLGDPVEIEALKKAFNLEKRGNCALGSVKSNVGHLDSAAGVAGFIKTVLALKHRLIPPSLHFEISNPRIDFANSPFYVNTRLHQWKSNGYPLRAGVSSFGIGGTNVHVILEEAPLNDNRAGSPPVRPNKLFLLSAKSEPALERMARNLGRFFREHPGIDLDDAAYTLQVGRSAFKYREMFVCASSAEAMKILLTPETDQIHRFYAREEIRPVIFMFPGQGAQYVNMGLDLYRDEPVFKETLDRCFALLKPLMNCDIKEILYPAAKAEKPNTSARTYNHLDQTEIAQPLLFIFEYALTRLIMHWGIKPRAMIGHSSGEYVAACLSGVFTLEEALEIVALRGRLMQRLPHGAMLAVAVPAGEITPLLTEHLSLAAINGDSLCAVSGPREAIVEFESKMKKKGYNTTPLHTSHAFHSPMMEPVLKEFAEALAKKVFKKPGIPYISNLSGTWITVENAADPGYWAMHLRQPVQFAGGLDELCKEKNSIFIEVGPGTTLSTFVRQHPAKTDGHPVINLVRHPKEEIPDTRYLLHKLGLLWLYGKKIDWQAYYGEEKRNRIPLPTYPFERNPYPFKVRSFLPVPREKADAAAAGKIPGLAGWFYIPVWEKTIFSWPAPPGTTETTGTPKPLKFLVFMDPAAWSARLAERLAEKGHQVISVKIGAGYRKEGEKLFFIDPAEEKGYGNLFKELHQTGQLPDKILHFWNVSSPDRPPGTPGEIDRQQDLGYHSLTGIARALGNETPTAKVQVNVFTGNMYPVTGEEELCPWKATVLGPVKVIPLEYPKIHCAVIDIVPPRGGAVEEGKLMEILEAEAEAGASDGVTAIRGSFRCRQLFKQIPFDRAGEFSHRLREKGVYLITGGLGGIGLVLAEHLAKRIKARLILTGRSAFPDRKEWHHWLSNPGHGKGQEKENNIRAKIRKVLELEESGAEVLIMRADAADPQGMRDVLERAEREYGPVNGVIHSAGEPGGAVIQRSTREMSEPVMKAKVKGTLVLDILCKDKKLDFFVMCSSLNSLIPAFGQAAYCSANAFLDAFAYYKSARDRIFTVSVNWDAWEEVGMSFAARQRTGGNREPQTVSISHPFLEKYRREKTAAVYTCCLEVKNSWVLDEHRIFGKATLPGTAYLEMVRAVFQAHVGDSPLEIRDIYFLQPLVVEDHEKREVRTIFQDSEQGFEFFIISRSPEGKSQLSEHARGKIAYMSEDNPPRHSPREIAAACGDREVNLPGANPGENEGYLTFGPRWNCAPGVRQGTDQALITLELPQEFGDDLKTYKLHPAMLDNALAGIFGTGSYYLPFSYKRVKIRKPFTPKMFSHIRLRRDNGVPEEFKHFQVTLIDGEGNELVNIDEYTLMRVPVERIQSRDLSEAPSSPPPGLFNGNEPELRWKEYTTKVEGIKPAEGVEIFDRILAGAHPQVVISTMAIDTRSNRMKELNLPEAGNNDEKTGTSFIAQQRPELSTRYAAPSTEIEKKLAGLFEKFMGIKDIGIHDNFFELGANSLMMVQLNSRLEKAIAREVSIVTLYAHPTIKTLSQYLSEEKPTLGISAEEIGQMKEKIEKGKRKLGERKQRKRGISNE
jgi:acyl transferase domain-containing protein/acyl carrier protein